MNVRHQQFVNEYLKLWNATRAYQRVYPKASYDTARANGATLLADASIAEAVQKRLEQNAMSADEVLARLAEHARGDMGDFVSIADGLPSLDLSTAQDKTRLIKKVKTTKKTYVKRGDPDTSVTEIEAEIELYDAQSALEKLGRHHKLFTDKTEVTGKDGDAMAVKFVDYRNGIDTTPSEG